MKLRSPIESACNSPRDIYVIEDFKEFERIVRNSNINLLSKLFRYIVFDKSKGILISILGDVNIVRVAISDLRL